MMVIFNGKYVASAMLGAAICTLILGNTGVVNDYRVAKKECESELPRNKQCVMTFVEVE